MSQGDPPHESQRVGADDTFTEGQTQSPGSWCCLHTQGACSVFPCLLVLLVYTGRLLSFPLSLSVAYILRAFARFSPVS